LKRRHRILLALACLLLLAGLALRIALRPENVARLVLQQAGSALGLEITAGGDAEYRLWGTPRLVLRDVVARERGAQAAVLSAERIAVAVPWSTLRSRGAVLDVQRVELDAPVLDLSALQTWLAKRPPAETRIPTFRRGLAISGGRVRGEGWDIEALDVDLPRLHPDAPVAAHVAGRFLDPPMRVGLDLHIALTRPANHVGAASVGTIEVASGDWRLPARIRLSGPLHLDAGALRIAPMRLAMSATSVSGATRLPFALGVHGLLRFENSIWTLAPVGLALRGQAAVPTFDARGAIALGRNLVLRLDGAMPAWNNAWPALPPPIGQSDAPLPFRLDYVGKPDASDVARLQLRREQARFDARFRLPEMLAWSGAANGGSPIPPLDGRITVPALEISGARLEGVEVVIDEPEIDESGIDQPANTVPDTGAADRKAPP
jgi:hypothetical protein